MNISASILPDTHPYLDGNHSCWIFPENTEEESKVFDKYSRGISGTITINDKQFIFGYSSIGNDGVIVTSTGAHVIHNTMELKRIVKAICYTYIKGLR